MRRTTLRTVSRRRRARGGAVSVAAALVIVAGLLQFTSESAVATGGGDMPSVKALVRAGTYRVTLTARTANGTPRNAVIYDKPLALRWAGHAVCTEAAHPCHRAQPQGEPRPGPVMSCRFSS